MLLFPRPESNLIVCLISTAHHSATLRLATACLLVLPLGMKAQNPSRANSDGTYQALRNLTLSGESVSITNLVLKRDAGTFHFRSGTVCFTAAVQGKVTGAVFEGDGNLDISPPPSEAGMLKLLTKSDEFSEQFNHLIMRFTDSTYEEIKKSGGSATGGCDNGPLRNTQNAMRHERLLKHNLDARILQDVLGSEPGGLFVAFMPGKRYN